MQSLEEVQAFVLCDTRAPGVEWLPVWSEVGIRGRVPLKALLFPNCTDEVAEAIKSACREGAEVVDLREDPSALMDSFNALNNAKILTDLALDKALGIDTEGKTFTDQRAAYLIAIDTLKQGTVFARDYENLRADNERLREQVANLSTNKARGDIHRLADALNQTTAAYNKGCADTIKAVTRLVDGGKDA